MNRLFISRYRCIGVSGFLWGLMGAIAPIAVRAEVPLNRADVESLQNNVEVILQGQPARPATLTDWLGQGDALRTSSASRAELRFNDGSLARIGERATFRFAPNTRNFRLSNGTVLLLIPPGNGPSTIQTPSAVTGVQGTALVIRHIPFLESEGSVPADNWNVEQPSTPLDECDPNAQLMGAEEDTVPFSPVDCVNFPSLSNQGVQEYPGRTIVMVLTNNPRGPVEVTTSDGITEALTAGHMAVVEGDTIQVLEFDLSLFYQTSPLVEGLNLDDPNFEGSGLPTDPVRQETLDGLATQNDFAGGYLLNPDVLSSTTQLSATASWVVLPTASETNSQTAASNRPAGLMSSLLMNRRLANGEPIIPSGVIDPGDDSQAITTANNGSGSSSPMPGVQNPPQPPQTPTPQPPITNPPVTNPEPPGPANPDPPVVNPEPPGPANPEPPITNPEQPGPVNPEPPGPANPDPPVVNPEPPVVNPEPNPPGPANPDPPVVNPEPPVINPEPNPPGPANPDPPVVNPEPPVVNPEPNPPGPANPDPPVVNPEPPVVNPEPNLPGPANPVPTESSVENFIPGSEADIPAGVNQPGAEVDAGASSAQ